jgi:argininosuccinate lyase
MFKPQKFGKKHWASNACFDSSWLRLFDSVISSCVIRFNTRYRNYQVNIAELHNNDEYHSPDPDRNIVMRVDILYKGILLVTIVKTGKLMSEDSDKPWAGRFNEPTDAFVEAFTASVGFDQRMYKQDIAGSIAHATMLARAGVLSEDECRLIVDGLKQIEQDIEAGNFQWSTRLEDVHMNIEARLTDNIGTVGKKLHTGRSRNDQVATDIRLYLRDECQLILAELKRLQVALIDLAEQHTDTILPGFTHLQTAQPITFGHHLLAWFEMLQRDQSRLEDGLKRLNVLPLGSAALAGTTYPIDREYTASLLGFDGVTENSLDSVSDRDFAIEFVSSASLIMMHLSRFSEELIIWSAAQFDFIELGESFCTGSSIMPQKKNPDVPELIRGKSGRVFGHLMGLLTLMKGQPLAYNKDNQEDKEPLFDTVDNLKGSLKVFADMIPKIQVKKDNMYQAAFKGFATATDLADYLVRKGVAFRDAHEVVGNAVRFGIDNKKDLSEMSLQELQNFSSAIEEDVFAVLSLEGSVAARNHIGGTAPEQVRAAIARARKRVR